MPLHLSLGRYRPSKHRLSFLGERNMDIEVFSCFHAWWLCVTAERPKQKQWITATKEICKENNKGAFCKESVCKWKRKKILFSKVEQTYIPYNNKRRVFLSCFRFILRAAFCVNRRIFYQRRVSHCCDVWFLWWNCIEHHCNWTRAARTPVNFRSGPVWRYHVDILFYLRLSFVVWIQYKNHIQY